MPFRDLDYVAQAAPTRQQPFERDLTQADADARALFLTYLYPELAGWLSLLERLVVPFHEAAHLAGQARRNGNDFQSELLASGLVDEDSFCRALAMELGLDYVASLDPERLIVRDANAVAFLRRRSWHIPVKIEEKDGATSCLIAPERLSLAYLRTLLDRYPQLSKRLKIIAPKTLRAALFARLRATLVRTAASDLFDRFPGFSARIVANAWQGLVFGAALVAFPAALLFAPAASLIALHVFFSLFFLACVGLRFAAIRSPPLNRGTSVVAPAAGEDMPVYSVLVALYQEADIVADLIDALDRIVWSKAKLEIKLVCEEDDLPTLAALDEIRLPAHMEVVRVPVFGPRTKPKALAYALPLVSGDLVALYDAEDSPDPLQLVEAWQRFRSSGPELACVQAPLEIANRKDGAVAMMFAFEYAALFRGLLPWLAHRKLLLPLGGTSNHFRRSALDLVGGWDPFNVTEDADLGVRLARFGYRTETISRPTWEAAPEELSAWLPQRTRWFKGWLQTWLVHMRAPARLARELGPASFLIAQILFAGMVVSALAHPFLLLTAFVLAVEFAAERTMGISQSILLIIDVTNISCGYASFLLLGWQTLGKAERKGFWRIVGFTPVYWLMMSVAAWRAVWQLRRRPHHWEKTPHRRAMKLTPAWAAEREPETLLSIGPKETWALGR